MNLLNGIDVFVQVAASGNYAAAGRVLGLSPSAVGKAIVRLESRVGVPLFLRDNRSITLTAEGERFIQRCRLIMDEIAAAEDDLAQSRTRPAGKLRVSLPLVSDLWTHVFLEFMSAFPAIALELSFSNRLVDLIEDGFDVALRIGPLRDSQLRTRRIGTFRLVFVASPDYLTTHGLPRTIDDLEKHPCLRNQNASSGKIDAWPLGPDRALRNARLKNRFVVDHYAMLLPAVLSGYGIACVPEFWVAEHIASGRLQHILAEQTSNARSVSAVWPASRRSSQRTIAFVDFVASRLPHVFAGTTLPTMTGKAAGRRFG